MEDRSSAGKEDKAGKVGRGPGQGHKSQGCCSRGPFPELGQMGLSEPNPIPWSSSRPGEISSAFPIILTQEDGEKKEKSLLETDYITATSQVVTSPSL